MIVGVTGDDPIVAVIRRSPREDILNLGWVRDNIAAMAL